MTATAIQHRAPSIAASATGGLVITGPDGQPAQLAVIDSAGNILAAGQTIATDAYRASVHAYRAFLRGEGHLRINAAGGPA